MSVAWLRVARVTALLRYALWGLNCLLCIASLLFLLPTISMTPCLMPKDVFWFPYMVTLGKEYLLCKDDFWVACTLCLPRPLWVKFGQGMEPSRAFFPITSSHWLSGGSESAKLHSTCPQRLCSHSDLNGIRHPQFCVLSDSWALHQINKLPEFTGNTFQT